MIKTAFALSFALSTCMVLPALGAEQFQCPLPSNPNDPAKLEQISSKAMQQALQALHQQAEELRRALNQTQ